MGVFHAKGWWPKTSCPPSKLCLPWVSKRGIRDVPGILPGCPGPLAVFKKFVQKNFVRIFRSLHQEDFSLRRSPFAVEWAFVLMSLGTGAWRNLWSGGRGCLEERRLSEASKRHLKRQQPQSDAKSDAKFAASVQFLTCHFTVVAFRGRCTILQKSSFHGC